MMQAINSMVIDEIRRIFNKHRYKFFDNGKPYNLNIVGIRDSNNLSGKFDDLILLIYRDEYGFWRIDQFECTTDPSTHYLQTPMNDKGTAILLPNQYRGAYKLGTHKGYEALVQVKPVKFVRDNNKDLKVDFNQSKIYEDLIGLNIHRANKDYIIEDNNVFSAGCQVIFDPVKYKFFIDMCERSANLYDNSFTYTLINESEFLI